MVKIHTPITFASQQMMTREVVAECRQAQRQGREISDDAARVIASQFQSPGTSGHVLASLASGVEVDGSELSDDLSRVIRDCYRKGDSEGDLMLDMFGTWLVRKVNG